MGDTITIMNGLTARSVTNLPQRFQAEKTWLDIQSNSNSGIETTFRGRTIQTLGLPDNQKMNETIHDQIAGYLTDDWSAHWTTNDTGDKSKIKDSKTRICDLNIYNNDRIIDITFVYFQKEKQIFVMTKEYVDVKSSTVLNRYNKAKKDKAYELQNETDNYAYFNKKGYMSFNVYHVKDPVGTIVYEDAYFLDVK